jgi:hypothetical protein
VIQPRDAALLETVIRREGRSLLQYVSESFPWTKAGADQALTQVRDLASEERDGVAALSKFLTRRRHTAPYLGPYPMGFTTMNFVSLEYLLPRLTEEQRKAVATLERDRAALTDAEAKAEVAKLIEMKRRHLKELEALPASRAAAG